MRDNGSDVPDVSVVIPYYDDQARLTLLLRALAQQVDAGRLEVIVADDGSPLPPVIPSGLGYRCTTVWQQDLGFRAAAARTLGGRAARGELLLFLDGDTLPTSSYVAAMVRALRESDDGHGVVVVGRRRHLDLAGLPPERTLALLAAGDPASGRPEGVSRYDDPQWLLDGYARTDDLRTSGDEDFRLVISAVLGVDRTAWEATGGFDADFVGYGGEDWDFGWRAWLSGAVRRHAPDAVAWHDGPDAAGRALAGGAAASDAGAGMEAKNRESLRVAATIPLPSTRGAGLWHRIPEITVQYLGPVAGRAQDAAVVLCVAGLLDGSDAAVWVPGCVSRADLPPLLADDPRVHAGPIPVTVAGRARFRVDVHRPLTLDGPLAQYCARGEVRVDGWLEIRHRRSVARGTPVTAIADHPGLQAVPDDVSLERWWGGW